MGIKTSRGTSEQFTGTGAYKVIEGRNLQLSPDSSISDKQETVGDVSEGSGLECFRPGNKVEQKQRPDEGPAYLAMALRKSKNIESLVNITKRGLIFDWQ